MKTIKFKNEPNYMREFLNLPKRLYSQNMLTNSETQEEQILMGTHVLSHYFTVQAFLVLNEKQKAIARCVVTFYPNEDIAYIGFFECEENRDAFKLLLDTAHNYCKEHGKVQIIGPVDASIWIKYRFKTNNFSDYFTGEPYNKSYYADFFIKEGYSVLNCFISNYYDTKHEVKSEKGIKRLKEKIDKGYVIKSPKKDDLAAQLGEIYKLLIDLYSDFPAFKTITQEEFIELYMKLKLILDFSMLKQAYYKGELVGFFVAIPNYKSTLCGKMTPYKFIEFIIKKKNPKEFAIMYLGVKKGHAGLGLAMGEIVKQQIYKRKLKCIGALIQQGKVTANYFGEKIEKQNKYVLLSKTLV